MKTRIPVTYDIDGGKMSEVRFELCLVFSLIFTRSYKKK